MPLIDPGTQAIIDNEHLKLLSLGYMISAGVSAFFGLFGLMYMGMGAFMGAMISHMPDTSANGGPPPAFVGWIFGGIGFLFFAFSALLVALKLRVAFCIKNRKARTFCMIVAALCCLGIPYGTALGALTFIALGRDSIEKQFDRVQPPVSGA